MPIASNLIKFDEGVWQASRVRKRRSAKTRRWRRLQLLEPTYRVVSCYWCRCRVLRSGDSLRSAFSSGEKLGRFLVGCWRQGLPFRVIERFLRNQATLKVRALKISSGEVSAAQVAALEARSAQIRIEEPRVPEIAKGKRRLAEVGMAEPGVGKRALEDIGAFEGCAVEIARSESLVLELRAGAEFGEPESATFIDLLSRGSGIFARRLREA